MTHNVPSLKVSILAFVAGMFLMPTTGSGQWSTGCRKCMRMPWSSAHVTRFGLTTQQRERCRDDDVDMRSHLRADRAGVCQCCRHIDLEPGTVVLGGPQDRACRSSRCRPTMTWVWFVPFLTVRIQEPLSARGGMLMAAGNATCPIQFSFLGDPMDGSVWLDVQGQWGGVVLVGRCLEYVLFGRHGKSVPN